MADHYDPAQARDNRGEWTSGAGAVARNVTGRGGGRKAAGPPKVKNPGGRNMYARDDTPEYQKREGTKPNIHVPEPAPASARRAPAGSRTAKPAKPARPARPPKARFASHGTGAASQSGGPGPVIPK
jgi:hypothetical protein